MRSHLRQHLLLLCVVGVVLLVGSRLAIFRPVDDAGFRWLCANAPHASNPASSKTGRATPPIVLVSLGEESGEPFSGAAAESRERAFHQSLQPMDAALFIASALPFKPAALAVEPVLDWRPDGANSGGSSAESGPSISLPNSATAPPVEGLPLLKSQLRRAAGAGCAVTLSAGLGHPPDAFFLPTPQAVPALRWLSDIKGASNAHAKSGIPEFPVLARMPQPQLFDDPAAALSNVGFFPEPAPIPLPGNLQKSSQASRAGRAGLTLPTGTAPPADRFPLVYRYHGNVIPSFALRTTMQWIGVSADYVIVEPGCIGFGDKVRGFQGSIPIDKRGAVLVNLAAPIHRCTLADLILSASQREAGHATQIPAEKLAGAIVILASPPSASKPAAVRADGRTLSRGEWSALALASIARGGYSQAGGWAWSLGLLALMVGAGLVCRRFGRFGTAVFCLGFFAAYMLLSLGVFAHWRVALPLGLPVGWVVFLVLLRLFDTSTRIDSSRLESIRIDKQKNE